MTSSNHNKAFKQLEVKPEKLKKYIKHNAPKERKIGIHSKLCKRCGRAGAHISKYDLSLCRQCFREIATEIGFKKYD